MSNKKIWLSLAQMSGHEQKFIQEAFDSNWVVPLGPNVDGFEQDLENYLDTDKKVVALSSGTSAIHLALIQLGVRRGDEVICQSFTFAASANPIAYLGATPVFVDSEEDTWNMSPYLLKEGIEDRIKKTGKKPKAIIVVHLYGMPAKIDEIMDVANEYDIPIVEDAAEALGSEYKGKKCGTFGQFACLSFNGNKMITTSGGGALVCENQKSAELAKFYATQARENRAYYHHERIGYNYRLSNISAGIGRGQMMVLPEYVNWRRKIHQYYSELLKDVPGVTVFENSSSDFNSNFWLPTILIDESIAHFTPMRIYEVLNENLIETRLLWKPMHLQPVFASAPAYTNGVSEKLFNIGLCLPSGQNVRYEDVVRITDIIKEAAKR